MPFSCFYRHGHKYLMCASPERFLKKLDNKIIAQPIKGTIARGKNEMEDFLQRKKLLSDEKEQAENVMVVDLVRNDLSRTAKKKFGSG
jgi:para-aminobenzoate synthetase component I